MRARPMYPRYLGVQLWYWKLRRSLGSRICGCLGIHTMNLWQPRVIRLEPDQQLTVEWERHCKICAYGEYLTTTGLMPDTHQPIIERGKA